MAKFRVTVTREDEYEIEFDESIYNEEFIEDFKGWFYDFDNLEEHAEYIAQHRARFQNDFIEGYGVPLINGEKPYGVHDDKIAEGLNINIISEDDVYNMEVEVEKIN